MRQNKIVSLFPKNIEQKLGFDEIRRLLTDGCKCTIGKEKIAQIEFSNNVETINNLLCQTMEMAEIITTQDDFPFPSFSTIYEELERIRPEGTYLTAIELHTLRKSLMEIQNILIFIGKHREQYPYIATLAEPVEIAKAIIVSVDKIIDANGNLKDNASPKLVEIRHEMAQKRRIINKIMAQKLAVARQEGWIDQDSELSIRDGRLVLPLNSTFKRKVQGIVHDESSTGKTSFVEPIEAFEANNAIANLEFEERKETIRILQEITAEIRPYLPDIELAYDFLGQIDAIVAKAKFSLEIEAQKPEISTKSQDISLIRARHPLLFLSFKKTGKEIVPLHIELNQSQRIIVISGPNAGGKSVCMKTVLLLQYMFQCGLPIPADSQSKMCIFNNMLIDIGDEQSIENDLSTYSSHLLNMKIFLERANSRTLFAIDEFGTGTEPILGGAIAESVLETLNAKGAFGIITTHYSNLKHAATSLHGVFNGAMLFDMDNMRPLYKLRMGSAGNSFAFEIAQSIGLPKQIIDTARTKIKQEHIDFDENLKKLEIEKQYVFRKKEDLKRQEKQIETLKDEYTYKLKKINEKRQEIIERTENEIQEVLRSSNKQIEQTIRTIKESHADKETTKQARLEMQQFTNAAQQKVAKIKNASNLQNTKIQKDTSKITIGSYVKISGHSSAGEVTDIQGKQATVNFGNLKMTVKLASLEPTEKPKIDTKAVIVTSSTKNIAEKRKTFSPHLDLRGKRGDEAMYEVKDFLETANMLQIKHVEILHGKGYGILRKLIRDYINTVDFVESCGDAPIEMGGDGITIVKLM